ncbi:hypothetical protein EJB05_39894, partial [Eragrostis curvula]
MFNGMSRLAVAVSVTVALSLAVFLTILVLLLADLFCAHLRRKRLRAAASWPANKLGMSATSPAHIADDASVATTTTTTTKANDALAGTPPFYYAQGVMHAPNNTKDLLLAIPRLEAAVWKWSPARRSSPSRSSVSSSSSSADASRLMYISNPVYELQGGQGQAWAPTGDGDAPSPFGITEEGEDEEAGGFSPPLWAMRKLPPLGVVACPPPAAFGYGDGRPSLTVTDPNRASSSSSCKEYYMCGVKIVT